MKLTNAMRQAFVLAAMNDVPTVDYDEQLRKLCVEEALKLCPEIIRKAWKDPNANMYVETTTVHPGHITSVTIPCPAGYEERTKFTHKLLDVAAVEKLVTAAEEQRTRHEELRTKLRSAAHAVTTRKALAEMLPEFEKYLPEDEAKANRQLPVVANIMADFVKAGWPKDAKKPLKVVK